MDAIPDPTSAHQPKGAPVDVTKITVPPLVSGVSQPEVKATVTIVHPKEPPKVIPRRNKKRKLKPRDPESSAPRTEIFLKAEIRWVPPDQISGPDAKVYLKIEGADSETGGKLAREKTYDDADTAVRHLLEDLEDFGFTLNEQPA